MNGNLAVCSCERVRLALGHKEPDHVPFDLGGTYVSLVQIPAYENLRQYLNLPVREPQVAYKAEQLAVFEEDIAERLETDFRLVVPQSAEGFEYVFRDEGAYHAYTDEWGIGRRKPKEGGFYDDMYHHPLAGAESVADLKKLRIPDPVDDNCFENMRNAAQSAVAKGKAVAVAGAISGLLEFYPWLRGYEQFYIDLAVNHDLVAYMIDRLVEFKCAYWERALEEVDDLVDVVLEGDDFAGQNALLLSPDTYRKLIKPRHKKVHQWIKQRSSAKLFFHSCGAVRPLIGDRIDEGIDILNPVQMSAAGMNLKELKQEFGHDLVFWGGGVNTQYVLGTGSPEEVRADVKRNIEALAPGGGFVFAAVHDIQANVPPENIMAMWEAWREFRCC